jgi:hypothetical protein
MGPRFLRDSKIHLFFEAVHLRNLHLDLIPEPDNSPSAAADEMVARRFIDVKIICHGRERHGAAHP